MEEVKEDKDKQIRKTGKVYAIKTCDKNHIRQEKMIDAIMKEKEIMLILSNNPNPFFIQLVGSFQDEKRLCKNFSSWKVAINPLNQLD